MTTTSSSSCAAEPARRPPLRVPGLRIRRLGAADAGRIDALNAACADFVRLVEGRDPRPGEGAELLAARPPGVGAAAKRVYGLWTSSAPQGGELAGVLDLVDGYPDAGTWFIGLLMFAPAQRGRGDGLRLVEALERWCAARSARRLQLIVQVQNQAGLAFWRRAGFAEVGRAVQRVETGENAVIRMERQVSAAEARSA